MTLAAILVVYTEAFVESTIPLFVQLARRADPQAAIVVVNNHPGMRCSVPEGVTLLRGNNVLHEFGAWQLGLEHVQAQHGRQAVQAVLLANDTFCNFRPMGALEQAAFVCATRRTMAAARPEVHGELAYSTGRRPYLHQGVTTNHWVATYLFSISRAGLDALAWTLHPPEAEVDRWVPGGDSEQEFFSPHMDPWLSHHFCAWLFGRGQLPRWRRAAPLVPGNNARMRGKGRALLCEQHLSLKVLAAGGRLSSVFHEPRIWLLRRVLARMTGSRV